MAMTFRPRVLFRQTWRLLQWRNHTFFPSNIFQSWQLKWVHNLLLSSFFLTVYIMNSCEGISSTALDSPFVAKNSVSRAIFYPVFLAFWCIIFLSFDKFLDCETKSATAWLIVFLGERKWSFSSAAGDWSYNNFHKCEKSSDQSNWQ